MATVSESRSIDWLSVSPTSGGAGDVTLRIIAQPNTTYDERNGAVTLKCGGKSTTFTVSQKQTDAVILSSDKIEIGSVASTIEVKLKSNVDVTYEIADEDTDWIKPSKMSRSMSEKSFFFDISDNESSDSRTGHIGIKGAGKTEIISIYQHAFSPSLILGKKEAVVGSEGGEVAIEISSNIQFSAEINGCDWIREKSDGSRSSYTLRYIVAPNDTYDQRQASIVISNAAHNIKEVFTVTQVQKDAIVIAKSDYQVPSSACELNFDIQTNIDPIISCTGNWIRQVEPRSRALRTMSLCFDIDENPSESQSRTAQIIVKSQDGSLRQEINVVQSIKTNKIIKTEVNPIVLYRIARDREFGTRFLSTALHGVVKITYDNGREEFRNAAFTLHGIWGLGMLAYNPGIPEWEQGAVEHFYSFTGGIWPGFKLFFCKAEEQDNYLSIFDGHDIGEFIDNGWNTSYRVCKREIFSSSPIQLSQLKPDACSVYPSYSYDRYGNYVPENCNSDGQSLWAYGDTWRGKYNMYELEELIGLTDEEIYKFERHFGMTADQIPLNYIIGLSVEQLIGILELQNEPNPYSALPAGVYRTNYDNAGRLVSLADKNAIISFFGTLKSVLNYTFRIPDTHFFAVIPENYFGQGSGRLFVESPRDLGNLDINCSTHVIEDNEYRKTTVVTINCAKQYLWENTLSGFPENYSTSWATNTGRWENWIYPNFNFKWQLTDTLEYYKERPDAPFRLLNHNIYYYVPIELRSPLLEIKTNPNYVGRKVRVSKPDWVRCEDEFILEDHVFEFPIDIINADSDPKVGNMYFTLEGDTQPTEEVRIAVPPLNETSLHYDFNGERPGYDGDGNISLAPEGGILRFRGATLYPDELSVSVDVDWLEPMENTPASRVAGTEIDIAFRVKPNHSGAERYGTITFIGHDWGYTQGVYQRPIESRNSIKELRLSNRARFKEEASKKLNLLFR